MLFVAHPAGDAGGLLRRVGKQMPHAALVQPRERARGGRRPEGRPEAVRRIAPRRGTARRSATASAGSRRRSRARPREAAPFLRRARVPPWRTPPRRRRSPGAFARANANRRSRRRGRACRSQAPRWRRRSRCGCPRQRPPSCRPGSWRTRSLFFPAAAASRRALRRSYRAGGAWSSRGPLAAAAGAARRRCRRSGFSLPGKSAERLSSFSSRAFSTFAILCDEMSMMSAKRSP